MNQLSSIEERLESLSPRPGGNWILIAKILDEVRQNDLFTDDHPTYTAWVTNAAQKARVNPSMYWRYLQALETYRDSVGEEPEDTLSDSLSPIKLVKVSQIARFNPEFAAEYTRKIISGDRSVTTKSLDLAFKRLSDPKSSEAKMAHMVGRVKESMKRMDRAEIEKLCLSLLESIAKNGSLSLLDRAVADFRVASEAMIVPPKNMASEFSSTE